MRFSFIAENGSPNIPLIVGVIAGVLLIGYLLWQWFRPKGTPASTIPNPETFATKFSNLPSSYQTIINNALSQYPANSLAAIYDGTPMSFSILQIPSGDDFQGIVFSSSDGSINIYTTYYEFLNWKAASTSAILSIPGRTLSNGVITNNPTDGYLLTGSIAEPVFYIYPGEITPDLTELTTILLTSLPRL